MEVNFKRPITRRGADSIRQAGKGPRIRKGANVRAYWNNFPKSMGKKKR